MRIQRHIIRILFILSIGGFVVINLNLFHQLGILPYASGKQRFADDLPGDAVKNALRNNAAAAAAADLTKQRIEDSILIRNVSKTSVTPASTSTTVKQAVNVNDATFLHQFVENASKRAIDFTADDVLHSQESVVIVVQVHKRAEYLEKLIASLSKAKYINRTLLIFSHDFVSNEINQLISSIKFCKVLQIFYPHSAQLFPNTFPGVDPNDCPRDATKEKALRLSCNNAAHPDTYGHYREASYCQTKHHWFWKINQVFDHLPATKSFNGPVLFLEEDHYVTEDFVHVLHTMIKSSYQLCPECSIFTLGSYEKNPSPAHSSKQVLVSDWLSTKYNMGMALNRQVWQRIKQCSEVFCTFDDYNWDWTLQYISSTCITGRLRVMAAKFARVFHIGECGVHHKSENCQPGDVVGQIEALLTSNQHFFFPSSLTLFSTEPPYLQVFKPNGGWGDIRDHNLCRSFLAASSGA